MFSRNPAFARDVLLDNADSAEQVRAMLPGSPECVTLVTSRSRLSGLVARDDALPMSLPLLSEDEAGTLLRAIVGRERVEAEPAAAARLGEQCALLPLALRIVAERVATRPHMTLAGLVAELEDETLDLLDTGDESTAVRAAFSWSYRVLPGPQARLFRLLGLHAGPDISVSASAALAGVARPDTHRLLDALADVSLLEMTADGRYRFHDLLRAYAAERANLVAAVSQAAGTGADDVAWKLPVALYWFFVTRKPWLDWIATHHVGLKAAQRLGDRYGESWVMNNLGYAHYELNQLDEALDCYNASIAMRREIGDRFGEAWTLNNLGDVDKARHQLAEALDQGLAESGHALIWGGSAAGLMNVLADNVSNNGGRIIGISTELLRSEARETADEMIFASSLSERKQMLLERSDCFVIMVGGMGTLDEATEMLELKKLRVHSKPIILLNQAGFYEGLEMQLRRMEESGFLPLPLDELVVFA